MKRARFIPAVGLLLLCAWAPSAPLQAGGPLAVTRSGDMQLWGSPSQIPYNPDRGSLGILSQTQAGQLVADSFAVWAAVPTASAAFKNNGLLPVDVNASNYENYLSRDDDGRNPIIYDTDGGIIDDLYGADSSAYILGFAAPYLSGGKIVEGEAVLNGRFVGSQADAALYKATMVHEFGHYIGMDHTQINSFAMNNGNTADDIYLPTMFPTATDDDTALIELNPDDIAWISELYPSGVSTLGAIEGYIRNSSGSNFSGANVIARRANDPLYQAFSCVSNYKTNVSGFYRIPKIAAGKYTVGVDQILPAFAYGSSVGPYDPPEELPGPPEFYSGSVESSNSSTDRPDDSETIRVGSGAKRTGINITLNSSWHTPSNITEKEPNNSMESAHVISGSRRISGTASSADEGELAFDDPVDDIEDLYFLDIRNAANIEAFLDPANNDVDLELVGFFPSTVLFAAERHYPATNNGNEEFGPLEIGPDGAYVGVSYYDAQGSGSVAYTLRVDVSRFPIAIEGLSPDKINAGQVGKKITITGSGFTSGSSIAFSGSGITVSSTKFIDSGKLEIVVTAAPNVLTGYRNITINSSQSQAGRLGSALEILPGTHVENPVTAADGNWVLY